MNLQFSFCCILAGLWTHAFHLLEITSEDDGLPSQGWSE